MIHELSEKEIARNKADFVGGVKALAGGVFLMTFLGSQYIAGNIAPYILTYYYNLGQTELTETDTFYILPVMIIVAMIFYPLGGRLARHYKPRNLILTIAPIGLTGIYLSAFMRNYWAWLATFSGSFGFTIGCLYILPVQVAWVYFPKRIGLAGGIVISGFGCGAFFFNFISTAFANPENLKPENGMYPKEVGEHVPFMIKQCAALWAVLTLISVFLINEKQQTKQENEENEN